MLPTIVLLEPAPERFTDAWTFDLAQLRGNPAEQSGRDGRHVIVRNEAGVLRLWLRDAPPNHPLAVILPLDDDLPTRAAAALWLWARIMGRATGREPLLLTRQQR